MPRGNTKILKRSAYYPRDEIISQGTIGNRAYYIEEGTVQVVVKEGQTSLKVAELGAGNIFGEMALITKKPRCASVIAKTTCMITVIERDEIESRIKKLEDGAIRALLEVVIQRLKHSLRNQLLHYRNLTNFQDRTVTLLDSVRESIKPEKREAFLKEAKPLLKDLQAVVDRYQKDK
ncbi:MAG: cyclic nucleotide-binding domain-containing protein [Pseudomonadota bacterium]